MLTQRQQQRAAKEARKLAMEFAAGDGPPLCEGRYADGSGLHCAIGWVLSRSGIGRGRIGSVACGLPDVEFGIVVDASDIPEDRHALPWALLALADALESPTGA
jgi:hypothetical protein